MTFINAHAPLGTRLVAVRTDMFNGHQPGDVYVVIGYYSQSAPNRTSTDYLRAIRRDAGVNVRRERDGREFRAGFGVAPHGAVTTNRHPAHLALLAPDATPVPDPGPEPPYVRPTLPPDERPWPADVPRVGDEVTYGGMRTTIFAVWRRGAPGVYWDASWGQAEFIVALSAQDLAESDRYSALREDGLVQPCGRFWYRGHASNRIERRAVPLTRGTMPLPGTADAVPAIYPGDVVRFNRSVSSRFPVGRTVRVVEVRPASADAENIANIAAMVVVEGSATAWRYPRTVVLDDPAAPVPNPPASLAGLRYPNLLLPLPREADRAILQLSPDLKLTALIPERERELTAYANGTARFQLRTPPLAWMLRLTLLPNGAGVNGIPLLQRHDRGAAGVALGSYQLANVHAESDEICWGRNARPTNLRAAHNAFFGAPFNADLTPRWSRHQSVCPDENPRHACDGYQACVSAANHGGPTPPLPHLPTHACSCQTDGSDVRHVHACPAQRTPGVGVCQAGEIVHRYDRRAIDGGMSLSTQRAYLKSGKLHLTAPEIHRFRVTLTNAFGPEGANRCPCLCCRGACVCHRFSECMCCRGGCRCTYCACREGECHCRSGCACCDRRCECRDRAQRCRCDRTGEFVSILRDYAPPAARDATRVVRGSVSVEATAAPGEPLDCALLSSDEDVLARVPDAFHVRDAVGAACVVGWARRQPDGTYRARFGPSDDPAHVVIEFEKESVRQCT